MYPVYPVYPVKIYAYIGSVYIHAKKLNERYIFFSRV